MSNTCWILSELIYLDLQVSSECHPEISIVVFAEDSLESLLKQGRIEGVPHHNVTPEIHKNLLQKNLLSYSWKIIYLLQISFCFLVISALILSFL